MLNEFSFIKDKITWPRYINFISNIYLLKTLMTISLENCIPDFLEYTRRGLDSDAHFNPTLKSDKEIIFQKLTIILSARNSKANEISSP